MVKATYWQQQTAGQPLFPDLLWSRPENKAFAGKLAVIGGNLHGFAAPAEAYNTATAAGVGLTRVLLPLAVKKLAGGVLPELEYGEANPSGSFAQKSLSEWLALAAWADGVLLAGDFGRNSETAIVLETFLRKHQGQVTITKDGVDYALHIAEAILARQDTTLVLSMAQLQRLCIAARTTTPITLDMDLLRLVDVLHELTKQHNVHIVVKYGPVICVAVDGLVSTTRLANDTPIWRVATAAAVAVWWLQNPGQAFQSLTTAIMHPS